MNILVTGGAGYIGSHACKALRAAGHVPVAFDNLSMGHEWAVKWGPLVIGDLGDGERLRHVLREHHIDAVMHFAALAYVGESMADPRKYFHNNVAGTLSLLDAMLDCGVRNLVFSSSCATYGVPESAEQGAGGRERGAGGRECRGMGVSGYGSVGVSECRSIGVKDSATPLPGYADTQLRASVSALRATSSPISETTPQLPVNPYGDSKLICEKMIRWYGQAYGLRWVSLRYFNAAGADPDGEIGEVHDPETHLIPLVLQAAQTARSASERRNVTRQECRGIGVSACRRGEEPMASPSHAPIPRYSPTPPPRYPDTPILPYSHTPPAPTPLRIFGTDYPTPDGTCIRDYIHVADLADAHVRALDYLATDGQSTALNLGTGNGHSVRDIIAMASQVAGTDIPCEEHPRRPGDPPTLVADAQLATRILAWQPRHSDLETIIRTAWQWHVGAGSLATPGVWQEYRSGGG